jgi:hypothetical protein
VRTSKSTEEKVVIVWIRDEALDLNTEYVIMCCPVRAIAHLRGAVLDGYAAMVA